MGSYGCQWAALGKYGETVENGDGPSDVARSPANAFANRYAVDATLDAAGAGRAKGSDANSFIYLVRANQLFAENGAGRHTLAAHFGEGGQGFRSAKWWLRRSRGSDARSCALTFRLLSAPRSIAHLHPA